MSEQAATPAESAPEVKLENGDNHDGAAQLSNGDAVKEETKPTESGDKPAEEGSLIQATEDNEL